MMRREPRTTFTALVEGDDEGFQRGPIDDKNVLTSWWLLWWTPSRISWSRSTAATPTLPL